jgi:hypothetical protein
VAHLSVATGGACRARFLAGALSGLVGATPRRPTHRDRPWEAGESEDDTNRILGSMRRIDEKRGAVRVEDVYDTEIDDLWSAITEPDRLARWIATVEGDLRVGGTIQAQFTSSWEGTGRIDGAGD